MSCVCMCMCDVDVRCQNMHVENVVGALDDGSGGRATVPLSAQE